MGAGGEDVHVDAELGDQHLGGGAADARDRFEQLTLPEKGASTCSIRIAPPLFSLDGLDAARRSLVTKNLGSALAATLSGAWKLPRHILRSGITAPLRHRRRPGDPAIFIHQGWRWSARAILLELRQRPRPCAPEPMTPLQSGLSTP